MKESRIEAARKVYENALGFFDSCQPEYFETANAYLTYAKVRLNEEIHNAKEGKL